MPYTIDFEPVGRRGPCPEGDTLLAAARDLGVDLASVCSGNGFGGHCKVQPVAGKLTPVTPDEEAEPSAAELAYGEDVIAWLAYAARGSDEAARMQVLLVEALDQLAADAWADLGARPADIVDAVVVGNTAIHHLFLRLPVRQLAEAPYVPALRAAVDVKAREVGLPIAPGAYVHLLPNIAGYVGADHMAMLLATGVADIAERSSLSISAPIPRCA